MGLLANLRNSPIFFLFLLFYGAVAWSLLGSGSASFEHLHPGLDAGNAILSLLLALFLWGNLQTARQELRRYLALSFAFAAAAESLHALGGIQWPGWMEWAGHYSASLGPATWLPSVYILPLALACSLWLLRRRSSLGMRSLVLALGAVSAALYALSFGLQAYADMPGMRQVFLLPPLLLWAGVIHAYWRERHVHPLFAGLAQMGVLLLLSDLCMLFSTLPHGQFAMMAHSGKLLAYAMLHVTLMRTAAEDALARTHVEANFFLEKERLQVTLESIGDAVITTDSQACITHLNHIAEEMTGWSDAEAQGLPLEQVFRTRDEHSRQPVANLIEKALRGRRIVGLTGHTTLVRRNGTEFPIEDSAAPIRGNDGNIIGAVLVFHDVSFTRKVTAQLTHQATHDILTGLVNRRGFEEQVKASLSAQGKYHSLLFLDLDQFKIINDTCGHIAGDALLRQVAVLLQGLLREHDMLARLGGDEFAVLLQNCPLKRSEEIADKLRRAIGEYRFPWEGKTFSIGVSIGLVNFSDENQSYDDVMRAADTACYIAKDAGRNRVHVYQEDDSATTLRRGEMEWVGRIQHALEENSFRLYRQKIAPVDGVEGKGDHYEILIRMLDEEGNVILPMAFIPAAERYNLMPAIDRWVVSTAFDMHDANSHDVWSINLSGASINDDQFLGFVQEQFARTGVPPRAICFEITETTAIGNLTKAGHFIQELRAMGCHFSLDDFGSGMSSFAYLKYLPVDYLKIDGSFVKDMAHDAIDQAMVEAINKIGQLMGMQTIAEFVENDDIRQRLHSIGVDYAQGFGIHRPELLKSSFWQKLELTGLQQNYEISYAEEETPA